MKKILFFLMLAIVPLTFIACSSDDDDDNNTTNTSKIVGVWRETSYWDDGALSGNPNTFHTWGLVPGYVHEFKADGTYKKYDSPTKYKSGEADVTGTYTFDGSSLAVNGGYKRSVTFTENGNGFTWEQTAILVRYTGN